MSRRNVHVQWRSGEEMISCWVVVLRFMEEVSGRAVMG